MVPLLLRSLLDRVARYGALLGLVPALLWAGARGLCLRRPAGQRPRLAELLAATLLFALLHGARSLQAGHGLGDAAVESLLLPALLALASLGGRRAELRATLAILATAEGLLLLAAQWIPGSAGWAGPITGWAMFCALAATMRIGWARRHIGSAGTV